MVSYAHKINKTIGAPDNFLEHVFIPIRLLTLFFVLHYLCGFVCNQNQVVFPQNMSQPPLPSSQMMIRGFLGGQQARQAAGDPTDTKTTFSSLPGLADQGLLCTDLSCDLNFLSNSERLLLYHFPLELKLSDIFSALVNKCVNYCQPLMRSLTAVRSVLVLSGRAPHFRPPGLRRQGEMCQWGYFLAKIWKAG